MTLKLRIWIALAALVFGLALAGTAEGRTCTCERAIDQRTVVAGGGLEPPTCGL
jgi:hypothetical protein